MEPKEVRYRQLIADVKTSYQMAPASACPEERGLYWYDACQEINLWTYWQGRGCLDAEIMLVGQDWGNPWELPIQPVLRKLDSPGTVRNYMEENKNPTDNNLAKLFLELGYDITKPCDKLFFTNFVLGYRNYKISGGFQRAWAQHDEKFFSRLVDIINPKVILCLGKSTYRAVMLALDPGKKVRIGEYNAFITGPNNPQAVQSEAGRNIQVFALAHCGAIGTMNRNRGSKGARELDLQKEDWRKIKPYL